MFFSMPSIGIQLRGRAIAAIGIAMNMRSIKTVWWWAR